MLYVDFHFCLYVLVIIPQLFFSSLNFTEQATMYIIYYIFYFIYNMFNENICK